MASAKLSIAVLIKFLLIQLEQYECRDEPLLW
jgi:hypothetical protein